MTGIDLSGKTVLFLVTEDWYFRSHRLPLGRAARDAGARVVVAARMRADRAAIEAEGFTAIDIPFDRSGLDPVSDWGTLRAIVSAYRRVRPDIVHHVGLKPVLYGSLTHRRAKVPVIVNAMAGMGFVFTAESGAARLLRAGVVPALRWLNGRRGTGVIVQNDDDRRLLTDIVGIDESRITIIRGSGVDISAFAPTPEPGGQPVAVCVSRMLWHKGIGELVEAARLLKARGVPLTVRLVGPTDANPASIPQADLDAFAAEGIVEVTGPTRDVAGAYAGAHIAVLPSYREGLPKSLLEAAACGRPMVATDVPGCREICLHHETGLLVPPRAPVALADALEELARDAALRARLGANARRLVVAELADTAVAAQTLDLYRRLLHKIEAAGATAG
ncbi:MAG TPA: glycosyltransferase family 4 protein [Kaistiaceae bacterium]|nr:glycosyltransferase family 4 protein [Kaistiaceae bacterium]